MKDVMIEEEAQEFVAALAVRYKELKTEYEWRVLHFIGIDVTIISIRGF